MKLLIVLLIATLYNICVGQYQSDYLFGPDKDSEVAIDTLYNVTDSLESRNILFRGYKGGIVTIHGYVKKLGLNSRDIKIEARNLFLDQIDDYSVQPSPWWLIGTISASDSTAYNYQLANSSDWMLGDGFQIRYIISGDTTGVKYRIDGRAKSR